MPRFRLRFACFFLLLSLFAFAGPLLIAHADTNLGTTCGTGLCNPLTNTPDLQTLLGSVLTAVIAVGTVVVTIMLVYCGFLFVVAQGNEEKIREARSALMWTIIGALVLLGAKGIQSVIVSTVNTL